MEMEKGGVKRYFFFNEKGHKKEFTGIINLKSI